MDDMVWTNCWTNMCSSVITLRSRWCHLTTILSLNYFYGRCLHPWTRDQGYDAAWSHKPEAVCYPLHHDSTEIHDARGSFLAGNLNQYAIPCIIHHDSTEFHCARGSILAGMNDTRPVLIKVRLGPENAGFLINCWVYGLIWKAWLSSLIWCMAGSSLARCDWVRDQDAKSFWPSQAQLRKPKKCTKFNVVLSILNHLHLQKFCNSY